MAALVTSSAAVEGAVHPTISFQVQLDWVQHQQAISHVEGWLMTRDGALVARLTERPANREQAVSARGTALDSQFQVSKITVDLVAQLDSMSLQRIDDERAKDPKRDVHLKIELEITSIESSTVVADFFDVDVSSLLGRDVTVMTSMGPRKATLVASSYDPQFRSETINRWTLSGNTGPTFLKVRTIKDTGVLRIPATDWITDYAPKLGLGKQIILEMPSDGELFQECTMYLSKAEEAFRRWDSKGVFSNCREVGSVLDKRLKAPLGETSFTYKERWGRAFHFWASLDLHNEDLKKKYPGEEVPATRADTEAILLFTKILVKFAQDLLREANMK